MRLIQKWVFRPTTRNAAGPGFLTAFTWQIGQRVLESIVTSGNYSEYDVVGSFLAVILSMDYASAVVLRGAES
jgi:hypothetical protein